MTHLDQRPDSDDLPHREWKCENCNADNSMWDAECQFCDASDEPEAKPAFYTVAIYLIDKAYGGPEEGGWWYECGQRIDNPDEHGERNVPKMFPGDKEGRKEASEFCLQVNDRLNEGVNSQRRSDIGSVLSEGRYVAQVCDHYPEAHFPSTIPHYE